MSCQPHRADLVALARGELLSEGAMLRRQRLEQHLLNCASCSQAVRTLSIGLEAARNWQPEIEDEQLERLGRRLSPYMEAVPAASPWRAVALATAAVAAVMIIVLAGVMGGSGKVEQPVDKTMALAPSPVIPAAPEVRDLTPFVRMVAGPGLAMSSDVGQKDVRVSVRAGQAAFSLLGGSERRLWVETPFGVVRVVGTRFGVEAMADGMRLVVAEGAVELTAAGSVRLVSAGQAVRALAAGVVDEAAPAGLMQMVEAEALVQHHRAASVHHERAQVIDFGGESAQAPAPAAPTPSSPAVSNAPSEEEILALLADAEKLAQAGRYQEALALYRQAAHDPRAAWRDISRYEMARVLGFALGERAEARSLLSDLARRGQGEVRRQSALALCELDREREPCRARSCLNELVGGGDPALAAEAKRLVGHWQLEAQDCPQE